MAKKKSEKKTEKAIEEEIHKYIDCPKCGGDMNFLKVVDGKDLYKCDDCKHTETRKAK